MAAKLLHSLADENPDLQKQIGCMTGIFQIFDRHQMVTAKRLGHRKLPAADGTIPTVENYLSETLIGIPGLNNGFLEGDSNNAYQGTLMSSLSGSSVKHRDSPRSFLLPNSMDCVGSMEAKFSADLKESLRVLAKLQEAPWYYNNEARQLQRSSDTFKSTRSSKSSRDFLDSKERSMKGSKYLAKISIIDHSNTRVTNPPQSPGTQTRPSNIVAKLMGLGPLPDSSPAGGAHLGVHEKLDKRFYFTRWKNSDMLMKPISSSRFPIEPAPWNMLMELERDREKIERSRVQQSGKDLRALKQILEAMQAKGFLETEKEEEAANLNTRDNTSSTRDSDSIRTYESPIVIMKPGKLVEKGGMRASTVIPIDDISSIPKIRSGVSVDNKRVSITSRSARDLTARNSQSTSTVSYTDKRANSRNVGSIQSSTKSPKESTTISVKSSGGSGSPRLQRKKLELDRQSCPPTPPADPSKPRRQFNRNSSESSSPGGKRRPKYQNMQQCEDQLSQVSSESWSSSHQGDEISPQSNSNIIMDSKLDTEVTSHERFETNSSQSPSMNAAKHSASSIMQKKSTSRLDKDGAVAELAIGALEHPSPVSVLDTSVYRYDAPSPVKLILNIPEGTGAENFDVRHRDEQWNSADNCLLNNAGSIHQAIQSTRSYSSFGANQSKLFAIKEDSNSRKVPLSKPDHEKLHRKLIFDLVNEILVGKLAPVGASAEPWINSGKLARKTLNAQKLLKELCMEIEHFKPRTQATIQRQRRMD
ncbi:hypothetical protein F3Y22_tig00116971pilonHSYRG00117 [Hibiscus syriacus]|uniref:DUF4378 domain-containing protein n=1 Tax=Hibiscus syriacus TaxID=106335 RepID=A0A6A2WHV3_HIBSY|nr:hypothetical protein F3Y22_tig00116971pilonHSYRG00117 [Hibiscus syriacus]